MFAKVWILVRKFYPFNSPPHDLPLAMDFQSAPGDGDLVLVSLGWCFLPKTAEGKIYWNLVVNTWTWSYLASNPCFSKFRITSFFSILTGHTAFPPSARRDVWPGYKLVATVFQFFLGLGGVRVWKINILNSKMEVGSDDSPFQVGAL